METNSYDSLDERKLDTIKLRILEVETDNIVKKESNPAMEDKIKRLIMTEVDKK
jgi:hypothetical protein